MKNKTTAFINGKVFTLNKNQPIAEAVLINDNKIINVGTSGQIKYFIDKNTEIIDLKNKLMIPGFIDCHAHIVIGGLYLLNIDLSKARNSNDFIKQLSNYKTKNPGKWILGGNWNHQNWESNQLPNKDWIDEFSQDTPIFVNRMDYHMGLANSCALKLAGITKYANDPVGGTIVKDRKGEPTGILKDKAMDLIYKIIPIPSDSEFKNAIKATLNEAKKFGVTTIHDISDKTHLKYFKYLENDKMLNCRIYSRLPIESHNEIIAENLNTQYNTDKLKLGSVKAFADGSLGSSTALFFEPYSDNLHEYGLAMNILENGDLKKWSLECDRNKLQLSIHAIGDKAVSDVIDIIKDITKINPKWDRRVRIEHAQHIREEDIKRCKELDIIVSAQPYHLYDDGCWALNKLGYKRLKNSWTFNSFLKSNVKLCFGSDWSVATLNPLMGIYSAVTRQTADGLNPIGLIPEEKISIEQALKCYTLNAAYAAFDEERLGSIEIGKLADLVVLNEDIFSIEPYEIKDVEIGLTMIDGEIVFNSI
ncbi:amidohydrolase [Bacteroidota bacterium]